LVQAQSLQVVYPVPRPGIRGWFSRGRYVAVHGASFELLPGRTLGVVGESGSGKTSLAMAVLGLIGSGGGLLIHGKPWPKTGGAQERALRRKVQVVFQDPFSSLSPRMTVEQIVGEGLRVHEPGISAN